MKEPPFCWPNDRRNFFKKIFINLWANFFEFVRNKQNQLNSFLFLRIKYFEQFGKTKLKNWSLCTKWEMLFKVFNLDHAWRRLSQYLALPVTNLSWPFHDVSLPNYFSLLVSIERWDHRPLALWLPEQQTFSQHIQNSLCEKYFISFSKWINE